MRTLDIAKAKVRKFSPGTPYRPPRHWWKKYEGGVSREGAEGVSRSGEERGEDGAGGDPRELAKVTFLPPGDVYSRGIFRTRWPIEPM